MASFVFFRRILIQAFSSDRNSMQAVFQTSEPLLGTSHQSIAPHTWNGLRLGPNFGDDLGA